MKYVCHRPSKFAVVALILLLQSMAIFAQAQSPSRLGLTGEIVFYVSQVLPNSNNTTVKSGDLITSVSSPERQQSASSGNCAQLTGAQALQTFVSALPVGTNLQVEFLRFNSVTGSLESNSTTWKTVSYPNKTASTLGITGEIGFLVKDIVVSTPQTSIKPGDIIFATTIAGQLDAITSFRDAVKSKPIGYSIGAEVGRYERDSITITRKSVVLTTYPYPAPVADSKSHASAKSKKSKSYGCETFNPCVWCCAECGPVTWGGECRISKCETGRTGCRPDPIKCKTDFCV